VEVASVKVSPAVSEIVPVAATPWPTIETRMRSPLLVLEAKARIVVVPPLIDVEFACTSEMAATTATLVVAVVVPFALLAVRV
jgi:hypothetical protein